jgi:heme-degrading monooxygenase HmoA
MARTLTIVKHQVNDYGAWRSVYDEVQPLRDSHGVTDANVLHDPDDKNSVTVLHWFASLENARAFANDPALKDAMGRAGVSGAPRIEIVVEA